MRSKTASRTASRPATITSAGPPRPSSSWGLASPVAKAAQSLLKAGLITAVASDAHRGSEWRPVTALEAARAKLAATGDPAAAAQLFEAAPAAILGGGPLPYLPEVAPERGKSSRLPWRR